MLYASARGMIKSKTPAEAKALIENMDSNDYEVRNERTQVQKKWMLELQTHDALLAQNKVMTQHMKALRKKLSSLP